MPKKKDALLIALVLLVAAVLLAVSHLTPKTDLSQKTADVTLAPDAIEYVDEAPTAAPEVTQTPEIAVTDEPTKAPQKAPEQAGAMMGPMPAPQTAEVRGHVVLTVGNRQYGDPIPMDRDKVITIKQTDGKVNKVHITPEKVYMESSSCDNQDCVGQGEISLANYKTRILSTFVICLPNEVTIEMVPVE